MLKRDICLFSIEYGSSYYEMSSENVDILVMIIFYKINVVKISLEDSKTPTTALLTH